MVSRGAYSSSREKKVTMPPSTWKEYLLQTHGKGNGRREKKSNLAKARMGRSPSLVAQVGGWDGKETKGAKNELKKQEEQLLLLHVNVFFADVAKLPSEEKVGEKNTCSNVRSRTSMLLSILMTRCLTLKQHTIGARIFKDKLFSRKRSQNTGSLH